MGKFPALSAKEVLRALQRAGFYIHHQVGSHVQLRNRFKTHLRVTIPFHTRFDLPPRVIASIVKQVELTREEFLELL